MLRKFNFITKLACLGLVLLVVPSVVEAQQIQAENLRTQARLALRDNNPERALRLSEQLLIANPRDLQARFLRATILVSLGRGAQIRDEVALMARLDLSAKDKSRAQALLAAIDKQNQRLALAADFSIGYGYTDNANSWPESGQYTYRDGAVGALPDPAYEEFSELDDTFYSVKLGLSGSYIFGQSRKNIVRFGISQTEKKGADTENIDSAFTRYNVSFETMLPLEIRARLGFFVSDDDRTNQKIAFDGDGQSVLNSDREKTSFDFLLSKKFGIFSAGLRFAALETDVSGVPNADISDAHADTGSFFIGFPLGRTNYFRLGMSSTEQRSDYGGTNKQDGRERVDKDSDNYTFLFVKSFGSNHRLILSYTASESDFKENLVGDGIKRSDDLELMSARYSIDAGRVWQPLSDYALGLDIARLEGSSNQAAANVESLTYTLFFSRKFDFF